MLEFSEASNVMIAENLITTETDMTTTTKLTAKLAIAVGVIATLALSSAAPSLAQDAQYYDPSGNGLFSSQYPGHPDGRAIQRPSHRATDYNARARAPASGNRGGAYINRNGAPVDDPPGSAFQTLGNDRDDMGCPC